MGNPSGAKRTVSWYGLLGLLHHDLEHTVEDIAKSLKDRQGGQSSDSNAPVMAVSVKKIDWRARFDEIDDKMAEEQVDEEIIVEVSAEKVEEKKKAVETKTPEIDLTRVPYPACLLPFKQAREHGHFLEMFKLLKKLEEVSKVSLSEQCFAVVQNKLPEKLGDSGHFTIPCHLGSLPLHHALADLDMEVDDGVPLILGRPFLCTAKVVIDVFDGKLTLHVGDESFIFDATQSVEDVGEHSHSMCILDDFIDYHQDSDHVLEVAEPAPNLEESSEWAVELERLLDEQEEYDDVVPDDVLEMMGILMILVKV
ncbi:hypothetical protein L1987_52988 [Smallanthus sonchifolius]|uniref:Uncharacterized protein n=1 Tax=Smallanthus sonchifolius TaxID=185202 RepID=A0ACB9EUN8_9ASTR|nr:hypothetical protein L1987_52988 [Smallanthus sonchifolius]